MGKSKNTPSREKKKPKHEKKPKESTPPPSPLKSGN
jgi:hypothetical protein